MKVTCPACGSANLHYTLCALVTRPVTAWERDADGEPRPLLLSDDRLTVDWDNADDCDLPYSCGNCACEFGEGNELKFRKRKK